jgi:Spy/CpxP family protein refolding chaperone
MTSHETSSQPCPPRSRLRRRWGRRVLLTLGLLFGLGGVAYASGATGHHQHPRTPEEVRAHVDTMIDHLITKVDGSVDQRAALRAIAGRTLPQMEALHAEGRDLKVEFHDLLTAEKIDRAALEVARKDGLDLADRGSKVLVTTLADVAETLTPAQRRKIADVMARFGR